MFLRKEVKPRQKSKLQTPQFTNYVLRITFQPFNQVKEAVMRRAVLIRVAALACMAWLVAMFGTGSAQEWVKLREEGANFYDIQRSFEQYWQGKTVEKGKGWKQFKRWEYWTAPRVYPSGILPAAGQNTRAFEQYLQRHGALMKGAATPASVATAIPSANWTSLGPNAWTPTGNSVAPVSAASRRSPFIRPIAASFGSAHRPAVCGKPPMAARVGAPTPIISPCSAFRRL
jgi:hypothetical protein